MRKSAHTFLSILAVPLLLTACKDDMYDNSSGEPLEISHTGILVDREAQTVTIGVTARDAGWTVTGGRDWCVPTPASGEKGITQVTVSFTANVAADDGEVPSRNAAFVFNSNGREKTVSIEQLNITGIPLPNENPDSPVNKEIHAELVKWYYNGEPGRVAADFNQSYGDFYANYLEYLKYNTLDKNKWSINNETYLHSYIEKNPAGTHLSTTPPLNYGMEFDLADFDGRLVGRILYVEEGSPAAKAGLKRGEWFYKVNDVQMGNWITNSGWYQYNRLIDSLVNPVMGESPRLGMLSFRATGGGQLLDEGRTVTLSPDNHSNNPILHTQSITENRLQAAGGGEVKVGYMMYNSFDPTPRYRDELVEVFRGVFQPEAPDNFILDLRYNKNGTVEMAELLGNLLVGNVPGVAGKTFAKYEFDSGSETAAPHSKEVRFATHSAGIAAGTVFILTSRHTAGASELLINALRGLDQTNEVKLVVIGETTHGLAAGMVKRTYRNPDDQWEYSAWMLAFRCKNARDEGDYMYGLVPNGGEVNEWQRGENIKWLATWGWKSGTGSTQDKLVERAMDMIVGREFIPTQSVVNASEHNRGGYQREFCFPTNMTMEIEE